MGVSIFNRGSSYRLRIRYKGYKDFSLTFHTLEDAEKWAEEHADDYTENPDKYHKWADANRESIKKNGIFHTMKKLK